MEKTSSFGLRAKAKFLRVICAIAILSLLAPSGIAVAAGVAMAPPVNSGYAASEPSGDSVFEWNEIPESQEVPIQRAVFDRGGYQLYDSVGETIVVPFNHDNLYVMKFAVSPNDTMYYVNTGTAPVLYVPRDGYLENAGVAGARWYPFSEHFHPATPVYEGIAPSYAVFVDTGWYPDEVYYGGYWCDRPLFDGGIFIATIGLLFVIGDHHCFGWHDFDVFCNDHPWFHHEGFFHPAVWGFGARSFAWRDHFGGTVHDLRARGFAGPTRGFNSFGRPFHGAAAFRAQRNGWNGNGAFHGYGTGFRGNNGARNAQAFSGNAGARNAQAFRGNAGARNAQAFRGNAGVRNARGFQGNRSFGGRIASNGGRTFQGAGRTFSAHHLTPGERSFGGGNRSFNGGNRSFGGGGRSFGGNARSFSGGGRSFGGNARAFSGSGRSFSQPRSFGGGGGRSFGGNARSSGGGGGGRGGGGRGGGGGGRGGGSGNRHQH